MGERDGGEPPAAGRWVRVLCRTEVGEVLIADDGPLVGSAGGGTVGGSVRVPGALTRPEEPAFAAARRALSVVLGPPAAVVLGSPPEAVLGPPGAVVLGSPAAGGPSSASPAACVYDAPVTDPADPATVWFPADAALAAPPGWRWCATDRLAAGALPPAAWSLTDVQRFATGNVGDTVRIGPTVHRPMGPWSPAVHALLVHLGSRIADVPRPLGIDPQGREVLSFLPGRSIDVAREQATDAQLTEAAAWLRRAHDAVADFVPPVAARWRLHSGAPAAGQIVCHLDAGAYNWVLRDEHVVGMIDWDMAGPGTVLDDLAYVAWNSVPLFVPLPPADAARRLRLMAAGHGGVSAEALLRHVPVRLRAAIGAIRRGQAAGDPGLVRLGAVGEPARMAAGLADLLDRLPGIEAALTAA